MDLSGDILWRALNALLAITAAVAMFWQTFRFWDRLPTRRRLFMQAHIVFLSAVAVGAVENVVQDNPAGIRTALGSAAVLWTLLALMFQEEDSAGKHKAQSE